MHSTTLMALLLPLALAAEGENPPGGSAEAGVALSPVAPPALAVVPSELEGRGLPLPHAAVPEPDGATAEADEGDEGEIEEEIEAQSAEMEQMREAEEKARLGAPAAAVPGEEDVGRIALLPQVGHDLKRLQAEYDIPMEVNEAVLAYIRFFQTEPARHHFVRWLSRAPRYLDRYRAIMREHGLPEDTVFLAMIESGFANLAYSRARACGPWQFIGGTGKRMGLKQDFWVDERRDPERSAHAAARYLRELYDQTGDWRLAWAGYNAGVGKIRRAQAKGQADFWSMTRGRVLKKETKGYVPKLMAAAIIAKHQEAFGFRAEEVVPEAWSDYELVTIPEATELAAIARAAEVPERELLELNPELRRSCTPPRKYELKLPKGGAEAFGGNWRSVSAGARLSFAHHRVQRGDSLAVIAAVYQVSPAAIARMNGVRSGRRLRPGTELVIPLSALARRNGKAPSSEVAVRARIEEYQRKNPSSVEKEPAPKAVAARIEEVSAIAQKFGVAVADLCRWNGIRNPRRHKLQIGHEIVVYPRSAAAPLPAVGEGGAAGPG
jgi:membrane-bound lytic murein transglycosylase D